MPQEIIRIFVGADRSQLLAVKVLEHSIKRHASLPVEVVAMCDLPVRPPKDPKQGQRTGFSFSRFCIPALAGYRGRAIYMDADMLVLKDIRELWELDFAGAKVIIQEELSPEQSLPAAGKPGAPAQRIKQCAVMLLDCGRLDWKMDDIIQGLDDRKYDYAGLMYDLCILKESEIRYGVPFRWNSLERLDETTGNIHYTDMLTQPWVSPFNENAGAWFEEVRLMLKNGSLTRAELQEEIRLGHFRPSLLRDIAVYHKTPRPLRFALRYANYFSDKTAGFIPHKEVYAAKKRREARP